MAQSKCDRKEAQGNMDAFLENPQVKMNNLLLFIWIHLMLSTNNNFFFMVITNYNYNWQDWAYQKTCEQNGAYKKDYANANMSPKQVTLSTIWGEFISIQCLYVDYYEFIWNQFTSRFSGKLTPNTRFGCCVLLWKLGIQWNSGRHAIWFFSSYNGAVEWVCIEQSTRVKHLRRPKTWKTCIEHKCEFLVWIDKIEQYFSV